MSELSITHRDARRMGFFTDTTVCIGCKACEVACKQWNDLPSDGSAFGKRGSYASTGGLSGPAPRAPALLPSGGGRGSAPPPGAPGGAPRGAPAPPELVPSGGPQHPP